jgi:aspartate/tyrosine/aromatic aminotransferase
LNQAEEQLEAEKNKPDADQSNVAHLNDVILQQQKLIADLEKEHAALQDKITERAAKYGLRLQDMENFAFSIMTVNDGWLTLQQTKDQIERTLTDLIINAQPTQQP